MKKIPIARLCRQAGVDATSWFKAMRGTTKMRTVTLAKLNAALGRGAKALAGEPGPAETHGAYKLCLVHAARELNRNPKAVLASDPSRKATSDPQWLEAAEVRRLAFWLATRLLGFAQADVGRAAGVTRAAVSTAVQQLEDERDTDKQLDRLLSHIEEVFS
ncbi:hypothetical protein EFV37_22040 [Mesorhizobium loti]|uniref:Uncharacterized protein n=1 Tax=Mesorhizobium jarvisii TaxID=1777867 RepID=A0A6M7TKP5_9HYPH|nr:hypothetical protein A9K72_25630 [Mesorhizobium loti]QKC64668.1 hypothetical protein EB229_22035 [Mesorhizobium jarvisii]QKD10582.1 hypothetical protein EFV37_22040 [Mesorhizobium loti]RJT30572.1 hypothetical protein D3242_24670 [Mesorhizobium jarvisii]